MTITSYEGSFTILEVLSRVKLRLYREDGNELENYHIWLCNSKGLHFFLITVADLQTFHLRMAQSMARLGALS